MYVNVIAHGRLVTPNVALTVTSEPSATYNDDVIVFGQKSDYSLAILSSLAYNDTHSSRRSIASPFVSSQFSGRRNRVDIERGDYRQ